MPQLVCERFVVGSPSATAPKVKRQSFCNANGGKEQPKHKQVVWSQAQSEPQPRRWRRRRAGGFMFCAHMWPPLSCVQHFQLLPHTHTYVACLCNIVVCGFAIALVVVPAHCRNVVYSCCCCWFALHLCVPKSTYAVCLYATKQHCHQQQQRCNYKIAQNWREAQNWRARFILTQTRPFTLSSGVPRRVSAVAAAVRLYCHFYVLI